MKKAAWTKHSLRKYNAQANESIRKINKEKEIKEQKEFEIRKENRLQKEQIKKLAFEKIFEKLKANDNLEIFNISDRLKKKNKKSIITNNSAKFTKKELFNLFLF